MITKGERYREILGVLARRGLGVVDDRWVKREAGDRALAENLRRACEELGPTFIKLGQVLSTRSDLLAEVYRSELAKLQSNVPPLPVQTITEVIREDLGAAHDKIFAEFDQTPLGSASIGQVHAARLFDGRDVVVKVRKPGVEELVQIDLAIMASLVEEWSSRLPVLEEYDARGLVSEFSDTLRAELDFVREAANVAFFSRVFKNDNGIKIPEVFDQYSKKRVITEERIYGLKALDVAKLPRTRREVIAQRVIHFVLKPAFEFGVFHADPHPGNLFLYEDDTLGVIDFGKVGRLTPQQRRRVADIFIAVEQSDPQRLTDRLIEISAPPHPIDRALVTTEVDRMLQRYSSASLKSIRVGDALGDLLQLAHRHGLRLAGNLVQFFKTLAMSEGLLLKIYPESSFADYLRPMIGKLILEGYVGRQGVGHLRDSSLDFLELASDFPARLNRILNEIELGNLRIWTRIDDLEPLAKRLERASDRTNAAMLVAACIVGLALLIPVYIAEGWKQWIGWALWIAIAAVVAGSLKALWRLRK